jgi:PAS domain S-box-containing protein
MSATPDNVADPEQLIADLQRRLDECKAERDEALQREIATAEVLQVINSSPGDLSPVFEAMLERAMRLCQAAFGALWTYDGQNFRCATHRGVPAEFVEFLANHSPSPVAGPGTGSARILQGERVIHFADLADTEAYRAGDRHRRALVDLGGARSGLIAALRKEEAVLGFVVVYRQEVRPFSDKQIALLQNFADQAVIAIENARLINETRQALEQQTATAEVLQVINSSPGDLAPVFDSILEKAMALCGAAFGVLQTYDGECFHAVAMRGVASEFAEFFKSPYHPMPAEAHGRMLRRKGLVHIPDIIAEAVSTVSRRKVIEAGVRTVLCAPLIKDDAVLGALLVYRQEVQPFTDKQIALLRNFAAQAVIAMENARLLTETREALEQQTATAEVLQVINASPGDLKPVFEAMVRKAMTLCDAAAGTLWTCAGEHFDPVAVSGASRLDEWFRQHGPRRAGRGTPGGRLLSGEILVHIADVKQDPAYRAHPLYREMADIENCRTLAAVGLRKEDALLGMITVYRQEVRPFSDKHIALLHNFAAQAVIATENARLLTETREALEQQTATAEVLRVINSSPGDLKPVFDTMLDKAMRLCDAAFGILWTYHSERFHAAAHHGLPSGYAEFLRRPIELADSAALGDIARGHSFVHVADLAAHDPHVKSSLRRATVDLGGARTGLAVPLNKDRTLLGIFVIYRQEVRPFSEKQIALLQNFAAQAVVAMESARLLGELRERTSDLEEALEYQTATSNVLQVISRSTFDLQPIFDTIVATAARLCDADDGIITIREGDTYKLVASFAAVPEFDAVMKGRLFPVDRGSLTGRTALAGEVVHIRDIASDPEYTQTETLALQKNRAMLGVPLLRAEGVVGTINLGRLRTEPFSERQIELARTFADQAVIALENTRLLTELRESLEQQQAIAEILQVINRSPGELQPVYDAILEKARSRCGVSVGGLMLYDGHQFRTVALHGFAQELLDEAGRPFPPGPAHRRLLGGERLVHIPDFMAARSESGHPATRFFAEIGIRTTLLVPLRKDEELLGYIAANRLEVRPFSDKEIALLESFAAQAVIAMDNARLLGEIRQRQAQLRVTFDNMGDGVAMFDADLRLAAWNRNFQQILDLSDEFLAGRPGFVDYFRYLAERGEYASPDLEAELRRSLEDTRAELRFERTRPDGRVVEVRRNAVPGGGFVLIYSDITERKRAEAEIRAARDKAETALAELQTAQARLLHTQKMAALGELTAGIAHEIKNPLNFVNNFAGLSVDLLAELKAAADPGIAALDVDTRAEIDETVQMLTSNLDKITEHGRRADGIVTSMLLHSRGGSGDWRSVDLNALVDEALNLAYHGARAQDQGFNITLERDLDRSLAAIEIVPQDLMRVFLNLFGNGFYAAKRRGRNVDAAFLPVLKVSTRELGQAVEIRIRDNGTGIAPEHRDKLFQPFFTTKPAGEGTGLGLSISYDIVTQQHGGTISVDSRVGEFTEFIVRLPRDSRATAAEAALKV